MAIRLLCKPAARRDFKALYLELGRVNLRTSAQMQELEHSLRGPGLEMDVVIVPAEGPLTGLSVAEIETRAHGVLFIVQVNLQSGEVIASPDPSLAGESGDGIVIVRRSVTAARALSG